MINIEKRTEVDTLSKFVSLDTNFTLYYCCTSLSILIKFIYSEKATKICEISTVDLSYVVMVKSTLEISQNFVAFSEYMNFNPIIL